MAKRIRINTDSKFHFVTFAVCKHIPVFRNKLLAQELLDNLKYYEKKNNYYLHGFVIMPNHVHLLIEMASGYNVSSLIRDIKKYFSYKFKGNLVYKTEFDLERFVSDSNYHFWERGFDEVTIISDKVFWTKLKYIHNNPVKAGLVQNIVDYPFSSAKKYLPSGSEDPPST